MIGGLSPARRAPLQQPLEGVQPVANVIRYADKVSFDPTRFKPVLLAESERAKSLLVCFEAGQFIPVHAPQVDMALAVLEGTGSMVCGDAEEAIGPGTVAFVAAGEKRGVRADTRLVILHVVTPRPTAEDHAQVMAGLQAGTWK